MLSSMQAVAHGSDSVQYFQWRKSRGSYEKFHGAVVDHRNGGNTRTFREVSQVGERLAAVLKAVKGSVNRPRAAIVFDWENWWALEDSTGPRMDMDYVSVILRHYQAFWENGIEADFINMEEELEGYALVSAPLNYLYREGYADRVRRYVENGGCYVTTYFSGIVNDTDLCFIGQHPLEDVMGAVQEEIDAPGEGFDNGFFYGEEHFSTGRLCEICRPLPGTSVLAAYEQDFYEGSPVVTRNPFGGGSCWYVAAETDLDFLRRFYRDVFAETGLENPLGIRLPYGVTVTEREGSERIVFVMNFSDRPVRLKGIGTWEDVDTGARYEKELEMEGFSCKILRKYGGEG